MRHPQGGEGRPWRFGLLTALLVLVVMAVVVSVAAAKPTATGATVKVGLITKDATNPFFVKMHAGATAAANKAGAQLLYAAGKSSSDNAGQITAIENMVTAGVKGILITVADAKAENAAIAKARKAGVLVIALDSPTSPTTAVDALFATNNGRDFLVDVDCPDGKVWLLNRESIQKYGLFDLAFVEQTGGILKHDSLSAGDVFYGYLRTICNLGTTQANANTQIADIVVDSNYTIAF